MLWKDFVNCVESFIKNSRKKYGTQTVGNWEVVPEAINERSAIRLNFGIDQKGYFPSRLVDDLKKSLGIIENCEVTEEEFILDSELKAILECSCGHCHKVELPICLKSFKCPKCKVTTKTKIIDFED